MWFAPLRACALDGGHVTVEVPNEFSEVWLKDNYTSLLQDALAIAAGRQLQIKFKVTPGGAVGCSSAATHVPVKMKSAELAHERETGSEFRFQSQEHLRHVRRRQQQQLCLRGRAGRGAGPRQILQSTVPLWRRWFGQNAFAARHRPARCRRTKRARASRMSRPKSSPTNTLTAFRTTSSPSSAEEIPPDGRAAD